MSINLWVVLLAAVSAFALGGLWYSPLLFLNVWARENGIDPKNTGAGHPAKVFGISFAFSLLAAFAFAWLVGPAPGFPRAFVTGLVVGAGFVAAGFGINYQFSNRSFRLWAVDAGYNVALFALIGAIIGGLG
jgi:hypothetical protein